MGRVRLFSLISNGKLRHLLVILMFLLVSKLSCLGVVTATDYLYLAHRNLRGGSEIYMFSPDGVRSTFDSGFNAVGVAFNSQGVLFASDFGGGNIYQYSANGTRATFASNAGNPAHLIFDSVGNLYATSRDNTGNLYKFSPDGTKSIFASGLGYDAWGLAIDHNDNLFVANGQHEVFKITAAGQMSLFAGNLGDPLSVAVDGNGYVYVGSYVSGEIRRFTPDGSQSTVFASVSNPQCLAFDSAGNLFEADSVTHTINIFRNTGGLLSSTPEVFASGLSLPYGIAFQPVPEPTVSLLLGVGIGYLALQRKRN